MIDPGDILFDRYGVAVVYGVVSHSSPSTYVVVSADYNGERMIWTLVRFFGTGTNDIGLPIGWSGGKTVFLWDEDMERLEYAGKIKHNA